MQVIYRILWIPTFFSTLVPVDQFGNTCYTLKIKLNSVHVHRDYILLYTPHTSQFVSVPWKHWKTLTIRMLSTSVNSSLISAGREKLEAKFVRKIWIICFRFSYQINTKMSQLWTNQSKFFITNCASWLVQPTTSIHTDYKPLDTIGLCDGYICL